MHLSKVIKEGMSGEAWAGLIDGVQAIVLTLLVLEMPDLIINIIEKASTHQITGDRIAFIVAQQLAGYLLIAIVIYDIWSIHKNLVENIKPSKLCSISTLGALWLSTLIPPMFFLLEHFVQDLSLSELIGEIQDPDIGILLAIRSAALFLLFLIYSLLLNLANNELRQPTDSSEEETSRRRQLTLNRALLKRRCIVIPALITISLFIGIKTGAMVLLFPSLVLAITIFVPPGKFMPLNSNA